MEYKSIVNYKQVSYSKEVFLLFFKITIVFTIGWTFVYFTSDNELQKYMQNTFLYALVIYLTFVSAFIFYNFWTSNVYIYAVIIQNDLVTINWQELFKKREITMPITDLKVELKPTGRNSQYLKLEFVNNNTCEVLEQTYFPGWNDDTMKEFVTIIKNIQLGTYPK